VALKTWVYSTRLPTWHYLVLYLAKVKDWVCSNLRLCTVRFKKVLQGNGSVSSCFPGSMTELGIWPTQRDWTGEFGGFKGCRIQPNLAISSHIYALSSHLVSSRLIYNGWTFFPGCLSFTWPAGVVKVFSLHSHLQDRQGWFPRSSLHKGREKKDGTSDPLVN
jgi:hypothetical protein